MPAVIRFDAVIVVVVVIVVILGLDILCCGHRHLSRCAVSSLSLCRRLYRHAAACLITPLSCQRLVVASSRLSPRQCLSCRAGASLIAPPPLLWRLTCAGWLSLSQLT
jgi:hypothetical protein